MSSINYEDKKLLNKEEYKNFVRYLSIEYNNEIHNVANYEIKKYVEKNTSLFFDIIAANSEKFFINFYYLDFLTKYFFKNSLFRFKLNLILALNEADYRNFNIMREKNSYLSLLKNLIMFTFVALTIPIWLILKIIICKYSKLKNYLLLKK
jgi:hypothetical protein